MGLLPNFEERVNDMVKEIIQPFIDSMDQMDRRLEEVVGLLTEINERMMDGGINTIRGRGRR